MTATTDLDSNRNIAFVKKTGGSAHTEVVVFGHGKRCGGELSINGMDVTIHFYIKDQELFRFLNVGDQKNLNPFGLLSAGELQPYETYVSTTKDPVPNYDLEKAAGKHIVEVEGRIFYSDLEGFVNNSNYDIISMRNRVANLSPETPKDVVNAGKKAGYNTFHLFFCRAKANGSGNGPRR